MKTRSLLFCSLLSFTLASNQGVAAKLPKLDSAAFDFKYEMEALPTAEDLDNGGNYALFGVGSRAYGGSFEVDYVRWTTDGVFATVTPSVATTLCIR